MNIRQLILQVAKDSDLADPREIAAEVLRRIPPDDIHDALMKTMGTYCHQVLVESRSSTQIRPVRAGASSHKQAAIREHWQRSLQDRVHVGNSEWKLLGDCTYEDLITAADERRRMAENIQAKARAYDALARMLNEHDVQTVRELPIPTLAQAIGAVAA